jgi:hypothetical protein
MRCWNRWIVVAAAWLAGATTLAAEKTSPSRVAITPAHVLSINGRPTFTIGLTAPPRPDARTPGGKLAFDEFYEAGISFVRPPMSDADAGTAEWIAYEQAFLEAAARSRLHSIVWLKELAATPRDAAAQEDALRRVVRKFRNHPGLGVWKGDDEPQWGERPVGELVRTYEILREEDPHHPLWIVQAPRGTVEQLRPYNAAYDIGGVDVYPIGYPPGTHLADENENKDISAIGDYTQKMLRVVDGRKPIWFTLQIAWSGVEGRDRTLRFPTFPQQRFMTYQAIINGARGLIYYGGNLSTTLATRDRSLGWNWTFWDRVLRPVIEEVGNKSPLAAALCAPDAKFAVKAEGNAIELCVREVGRDVFVLACCRDPQKTAEVTFAGLPPELGKGEVLYESPRTVRAKDGTFTDWFAPYDVHVYRFRRP